MRVIQIAAVGLVVVSAAVLMGACTGSRGGATHSDDAAGSLRFDADDIGGVVRSSDGPEAGVWVIAETTDLPTKFAKIVVTDDLGRYVLPDLPKARYVLWVRGYGLVDSAKIEAIPGYRVDLRALKAPDERAAAQVYPAIYWYAMLQIPPPSEFGGKGTLPANVSMAAYLNLMKNNGCIGCHQLGQLSTRTLPAAFAQLGAPGSHHDAWIRRVQSGQSGEQMINQLAGQLGGAPFKYLAQWTERIAAGDLPRVKPERPQGLERNVVVSSWEWGDPKHYLHDLIASDRRDPTVNAYGPLFGSPEYSSDLLPILDPRTHRVTTFNAPVRDKNMKEMLGPGHAASAVPLQPSPYWGNEKIWNTRVNNHNSMFDGRGRLWLSASLRDPATPDFCKKGSSHPSARLFPLERSARQISLLEPRSMKYSFIDTCFNTHHLQFGYDRDDTLWTSGGGPVLGWINTRLYDQTGDAARAQGWTAFVIDTNGNGKRDDYTEPGQPRDPNKDLRFGRGLYAVMPHPSDGSVWGTVAALGPAMLTQPGAVIRVDPGLNPPHTAMTEVYNVPAPGFGVRGGDIDPHGVVWVSLGSGHLGAFDRRKCTVLRGPTATGDHCAQG